MREVFSRLAAGLVFGFIEIIGFGRLKWKVKQLLKHKLKELYGNKFKVTKIAVVHEYYKIIYFNTLIIETKANSVSFKYNAHLPTKEKEFEFDKKRFEESYQRALNTSEH